MRIPAAGLASGPASPRAPRRGGERLVEFQARLLEGSLALLQVGFVLCQGLVLQLELAPGGLSELKLCLVGFAAGHVPELAGGLDDGKRQVAVVMAARLT